MKKIDLYKVLVSPVITEKANRLAEKNNQVTFKVLKSATKLDVKYAFELVFEAKVESVRLLNVKGKTKRFGGFTGRRVDWKKAYINLMPGQNFDLASNQK